MIYQKRLLLVFACLVISSCNLNDYRQFKIDTERYYFTFDQKIPSTLQDKINITIGYSSDDMSDGKTEIHISKYELKTSDIYAGSALRSLEKEIKASLSFNTKNPHSMNKDHSMHMNHSMNGKTLNVMKRFSAIELNPLAENELMKFMENEAINDLIDQLILEVSLLDL